MRLGWTLLGPVIIVIGIATQHINSSESSIPEGWTEEFSLDPADGCICCFDGIFPDRDVLYSRPPATQEINAMVANILKYAGLAPNFRVVEVDDNNAYAAVRGGERILGFGDQYLKSISSVAGTDWGRLGVMAHEVGHHVQGHTDDDLTQAASHQRELQADEYAGFICGMMGASREDCYAHTALMSEEGSASHPPRSERIDATVKGWLMAQHIRRSVTSNQSCPLFQFTGDGFEKRQYEGTIGTSEVVVNLARSPDRTIFGSYEMMVGGAPKQYRFVGRSNDSVNKIRLEEYFGCEPSATIDLARFDLEGKERWKGTMVEPGGKEFDVEMYRAVAPAPQVEKPRKKKNPVDPSEANYVTTLAGFTQRWFPVVSKNTLYTDQAMNNGSEFPIEWVNKKYDRGYRITHVAGDENHWGVVMSKGSGLQYQKLIGPGPISETRYGELRDEGYRITSLAGYKNTWVMVMSKNSGLGDQRFTFVGPFREDWVDARMDEGYRITQVAGDDDESGGSWMVVMSQGTGYGRQVYSNGSSFPEDWIVDRWDEGYRITSASGYDNWRVVMTKASSYTYQSYGNPSAEFPIDFITERWGKAHGEEVTLTEPLDPNDVLIVEEW